MFSSRNVKGCKRGQRTNKSKKGSRERNRGRPSVWGVGSLGKIVVLRGG